jgi:hypothetical protein
VVTDKASSPGEKDSHAFMNLIGRE